jgi:tRNA nucleotidyltransferase (CCA-adding enzyme)
MQTYLVGGAVRDKLLGLRVKDRDWVVVGSTPEQMTAQGFLPVGKDFPVFLHPASHEEYALARTERKTAPGYHGFAIHAAPDVTLTEDLARRDLTINAIAVDAHCIRDDGQFGLKDIVDPYGGQSDLKNGIFRHISPAFREDPVRILRIARFAAQFPHFSIAPSTLALMCEMVASGEVDHLVSERVWQELARGLMQSMPSRLFTVLRDCGALTKLVPELDQLWGVAQRADYHPEVDTGVHVMLVLDMSAQLQAPLPVRFACLGHDLGKGTTPADVLPRHLGHEERSARLLKGLCDRMRVPTDCRELADVMAREHSNIHRSSDFSAGALVRLLERCDALRKPERFAQVLLACECDARGRLGFQDTPYPQRQRLLKVLALVQRVDTKSIAASAMTTGDKGKKLGELIHQARVAAVQALLH